MILKPESCYGCPLYNKSQYFTPDYIVPDSKIAIIGQAPGKHEEQGKHLSGYSWSGGKKHELITPCKPQPLIGSSGNWLRKDFWPKTELDYRDVSRHNILKCRPYNSNDLPTPANNKLVNGITVKELKEAITHCMNNHLHLQPSTKYILAMGEIALYALTGDTLLHYKRHITEIEDVETGEKVPRLSTVTEWRGNVLGKSKVDGYIHGIFEYYNPVRDGSILNIFPVVHLASLFENEKWYEATLYDYQRFGQLVRGEWPKPLPDIKINILPESLPKFIGFDTEYSIIQSEGAKDQSVLTMWSLATLDHDIYVVDAEYSSKLTNIPDKLVIVTQNGRVDLPHLLPLLPKNHNIVVDDCMLAFAVTHAGSPTSLDYQLSLCGSYNRHKHLRESTKPELKYLYAGLDADTTLNDAWRFNCLSFKKDNLLYNEYIKRRRGLIPIITKSEEIGIATHTERLKIIKEYTDRRIAEIEAEAKVLTHNEQFNIRSPGLHGQIGQFLYNRPPKVKIAQVKKSRKKLAQKELTQEELFNG